MSDSTKRNEAHFNENAATYNSKHANTIEQVQNEIVDRKDWIGVDWVEEDEVETFDATSKKIVRLLDYACGTGLVSRALAPYVTNTTGIDLSSGMTHEFNTACENQGISTSEMHAFVGNLLDPADPRPAAFEATEFWNFEIATVGLGFHHFDDPTLAAKRLSERLKKGGVLMIIDFLPHGKIPHHHHHNSDAHHTVTHQGFSEEEVERMFQEAGVGKGFSYVNVGTGVVTGKGSDKFERTIFMARGTKS